MDRIYLNEDWYFSDQFEEEMIRPEAGTEGMQKVRLPHTVCETPFNYFPESRLEMVSCYRRLIRIEDAWRGGHILLTFEGAAHEATVYINGKKAAVHHSGYTAFTIDMVPYLTDGAVQTVTVRLDSRRTLNQPPFGGVVDYMTYGGLYREVYLEVKPQSYIEDVYVVTPDVLRDDKVLKADVTLQGFKEGLSLQADLDLWQPEDMTAADEDFEDEAHLEEIILSPQTAELRNPISCLTFSAQGVLNWDLDFPQLYVLTLRLMDGDKQIDEKKVRFGFREIAFDADGFFLNGEPVKLRGLDRHQSWPYVGYAMPKRPQQLDADLLKGELGCNIVRTSHYPQSQYFIDRCDEIGLLVFTEIPGWQHIGDRNWKKIAVRNVREMILQYRNHPSIIMWGTRINESPDDDSFYYKTNRLAHELDLYRPTGGVRNFRGSHLYEDVYTYNDFIHSGNNAGCEPKKHITSDMEKGYFISEYNGHMYPTKMWDDEPHRIEHALRHARVLQDVAANDDIAGCTGWCMFDYNTCADFGSGDHICYHGVMDMFRNPKLAAAVYKSQSDDEYMMEVANCMEIGEYPGAYMGDLYVFTNADSVRLYRNDKLIGEYYPDEKRFGNLPHPPVIIDDLIGDQLTEDEGLSPLLAGELKKIFRMVQKEGSNLTDATLRRAAVLSAASFGKLDQKEIRRLFDKYGSLWGASAVTWTFEAMAEGETAKDLFGQPLICVKKPARQVHLSITADTTVLAEGDSYDAATVHIEAVDENGNHLSYYQEPLRFEASGAIELIGPELVSMQGGWSGTYVKTKGEAGQGSLVITGGSGSSEILFEVEIPSQANKRETGE